MSRHLIDNRSASQGGRQKNFFRIERSQSDEAGHLAVRQLHQRPASRDIAARVRNYLIIEKGWTA